MAEENKIRDAADAVAGLVKAVPIYEDALQPAAREVGVGLQTLAKTIHIVLAPVSAMVWGFEQIRDFLVSRLAEKLQHVPLDRIQTPDPHVVGPALIALRFTAQEENLRELYANLLATSLDAATAKKAHPAFVDIINSMTPDEARIMRVFTVRDEFPLLEVRLYEKQSDGFEILYRAFSFIGREAGCSVEDLTPVYLDNLTRLGLLETPGTGSRSRMRIADAKAYEPLQRHFDELTEEAALKGKRVGFEHGLITTTDLGKQFCQACVIDKAVVSETLQSGATSL